MSMIQWPIRWIHEFGSNEFGFNESWERKWRFQINGVAIAVEIIPDTGIPSDRAGFKLSPQRYFKGSGRTDTTA